MPTTVTRVKPIIDGWNETDNQSNSLATATRAAEAGKVHHVTGVSASFSLAATGILLVIKDGTTEIYREYIHNAGGMSFPGLQITKGGACSAELSAGGAGATGAVNLQGYTTG